MNHPPSSDFCKVGLVPSTIHPIPEPLKPRNSRNKISWIRHRIRSFNTAPITRQEYAHYYNAWGGSFILHPEVLQFFEDTYGIKTDYRGYFKAGACIAAVGTWGQYIAGDRNALRAYKLTDHVDFGYPTIYMPIAPGNKCTVLYRTGYLLNLQRTQIEGAVFTRFKKMSILKQIPEALPTGKKEFQIKERRFERLGGTSRNIQDVSPDEIAAIYGELFQVRWNRLPQAVGTLKPTLNRLHRFLYGKVLSLKNRPVAIQINYRAETARTICVDYVNGGVDKSFNGISPGSLLSYINGRDACTEGRAKGKQIIYSYGKSNTEYKDQWCDQIARGFTGFWMP